MVGLSGFRSFISKASTEKLQEQIDVLKGNKEIVMNLKTYVGRMFLLKNFRAVRISTTGKIKDSSNKKLRSDFNDIVFIFDESSQYVKVGIKAGGAVWIKKFYLLKEIKGEPDKPETSTLENVLNSITFLLEKCDISLLSEKDLRLVNTSMMDLREIIKTQRYIPLNLDVL